MNEINTTTKTIAETSIEARLLYARLNKTEAGELIPYGELSEIAGRDVKPGGDAYFALYRARAMCEREDGIVFECARSVGIKRLDDAGIIATATSDFRSIGRRAKKAMRRIAQADYQALGDEDKATHNAAISALGAVRLFTKPASIKRIEAAVKNTQGALPVGRALELFKK